MTQLSPLLPNRAAKVLLACKLVSTMAAIVERTSDAMEPVFPVPARLPTAFTSGRALRKSVSVPHLPSMDAPGMEVYVIQRPFLSFGANVFKRLPPAVGGFFIDVGVCHYMTIFKTPSGQLYQFDFGPKGGGDISLGPQENSRMARLFRKKQSKAVPAEIREAQLLQLPEAAIPFGKTNLTLQQIRTFNEAQRLEYEVHKSDCRHYVDRLVQYSTGRNRAAAATAKLAYELKRQRYTWTSPLTMCTDAQYYNHLKIFGQVSVATAAMLTNRGKLTKFWGPKVKQAAIPASKALTSVSPAMRRKVLPTAGAATAGVAMAAWTDAPVIRNVVSIGEGVKQAACRSISWMGMVARGAGSRQETRVLRLPFRRRATQTALAVH